MKPARLLSPQHRRQILESLEHLSPGEGAAEREASDPASLLKNFLPTPTFKRALDPNAFLIIGERGAGKTELFRVLGSAPNLEEISGRGLRIGKSATLVAGYGRVLPQETGQPDGAVVQQLLGQTDEVHWHAFWLGMLAARLSRQGEFLDLPADLSVALNKPDRVGIWHPMAMQKLDALVGCLNSFEATLLSEKRTILVTYDELDRVVPAYRHLFAPLRALLSLWLEKWRSWTQLRPKIILRTDLWESRLLAFPDASKLAGHRVDLDWRPEWLYQMAIKRMLNGTQSLREFVIDAAQEAGAPLTILATEELGLLPQVDESAFAAVVTAMVGEFMGANPRKGWTYSWIPNHIQDAKGRALPRPFLNVFALAARVALDRTGLADTRELPLFIPSDLGDALARTSERRMDEVSEARAWLQPLRTLFDGKEVPVAAEEVVSLLAKVHWPEPPDLGAPPTNEPGELLGYLIELGLFERRPDGRLNVPDIYRHGLGMKRRGGVPQRSSH